MLVGLLRHFTAGWAALETQLLAPNPAATFDLVLSTDGRYLCTPRDADCECQTRRRPAHLRTALRQLYNGSSRVRLIHLRLSSTPLAPPPWNRFYTHWGRLSEIWNEVVSDLINSRVYHHVLVARPDAALSRPLFLAQACARHPGFNLVSGGGSATRQDYSLLQRLVLPREGVHNNQWDFGVLACDNPALLGLWVAPWKSNCFGNVTCTGFMAEATARLAPAAAARLRPCPVPAPSEFLGSRTFKCGDRHMCLVTSLFAAAGVRLGTLDACLAKLGAGGAEKHLGETSRTSRGSGAGRAFGRGLLHARRSPTQAVSR